MRGTRVTRALTPSLTLLTAALALTLSGCAPPPPPPGAGWIEEFERGRNGVSLEVRLDDDDEVVDEEGEAEATTEEVYLVPNTTCRVHTYLHDCADEDDYLVPRVGARPGLNRNR